MKESENSSTETRPVIFFDGVCSLCNSGMDFIVRFGDSEKIAIAPLQGSTAKKILQDMEVPDSIIFYKNGEFFYEARAVSEIAIALGGIWKWLGAMLKVFPSGISDPAYRWIARNRYRMFGKKDTCRIPSQSEKQFFLD